jgi:hypothetical protein
MSVTPNTIDYPKALDPAQWDANKGTLAKMAGETGIGAQLKKLQAAHKQISWEQLTAYGYGKLHNHAEVDEAEKKAKAYFKAKVVPYSLLAGETMNLALAVAKKFAANKLIPKASTLYVAQIAKSADIVKIACKSMDAEFKTFDEMRAKLTQQIEGQKKLIGPNIKKLEAGLKACIAKPSKDAWNTLVLQQCRSINNGVQLNPEWKKEFGSTWVKHDGTTFFGKLKDEKTLAPDAKKKQEAEIVKMCKEIQRDLSDLASKLG